ncbi:hypothetical protein GCM10020358_36660 [Amorphoplanes nipponensis]
MPGVLLTAAVATASLAAPAPAGAAVPAALRAAPATASCHPAGVTAADTAIAQRLRPAMTGRRLGRSVNGYTISCARAIVEQVKRRGLPVRAAVIAVTTAITESTLHNYTVAVDHDSLGLFQQRPSMGWGWPEQLLDPRFATDAFLDKMIRLHPGDGWAAGDIGQISQRVQVSRYPAAYAPEANDARLIVAQLWSGPAAAPPPARPGPGGKKAGPFGTTLLKTVPGFPAALDQRHQVLLADWNGDGESDLVVVQPSGTVTGKTEVRVVNGAYDFQHLLLNTATALPATDTPPDFAVADWNADGRPDLLVIQRPGPAGGRTVVKILDGASYLQRTLLETATALGPADACHAFSVAEWNADGHPDLVVVRRCGTASGKTEVRVLDGASNFQRYLQESVTALGRAGADHSFAVADWNGDLYPDLVVLRRSGAKSERTVLQVLNGATRFRSFLVKNSVAPVSTDARHSLAVTDWNQDGRFDLVVVQKWGTAGGRTEARILAG